MMSKKIEKTINSLSKELKELVLDIDAIAKEYEEYTIADTDEGVRQWFESMPIESLDDSIRSERGLPRTRMNLKDLQIRFGLRKEYARTVEEQEKVQRRLQMAKIGLVLDKIARIEKEHD